MNNLIEKIEDGRTDLIFDFIGQGNDVNSINLQGIPLIVLCAYYGDVSAIKYLLSQGASLKSLGVNYDLNGAAFHGHWQLCQYLLEQGADPDFSLPETGETPLHSCLCKANNPVSNLIIELLLKYGANPNAQTQPNQETGGFMRDVFTKGETPLHRAAAFGDPTSIQLLLDGGADKTIKDMNGDSPLTWASWHLRPGKILSMLCYGKHTLHPLHVERNLSDHGAGWGSGSSVSQLGKIHL